MIILLFFALPFLWKYIENWLHKWQQKILDITSVLFVLSVLGVSGAKPLWENPTGHNRGGSCVDTKLRGAIGIWDAAIWITWRSSVGLLTSVPGHSIHLHWLSPNSKLSHYETKTLALRSFFSFEFFVSKWFPVKETLRTKCWVGQWGLNVSTIYLFWSLGILVPSFQFATFSFPLQTLL